MIDDRVRAENLKISVLSGGLHITPEALDALGGPHAITAHEYATTGGIPLRIGNVYLNAPFDDWYCNNAAVALTTGGQRLVLTHDGSEFAVDEVYPLPGYVGLADGEGRPYTDLVFSHMDRARLSPISGCAYDCAFCDLPGRIDLSASDRLIDAAEIALADSVLPPRHLLISGGSPGKRQQDEFVRTVERLVDAFGQRLPVDVMMSAGIGSAEHVRRFVDAGVHGLALNMELWSASASEIVIRGKHRRARPYLEETISTAVALLPAGRVRSLIIPGLEPLDATLKGVEQIARLGADPTLSPFRPARNTRLTNRMPPSASLLRDVLDGARAIVSNYGVALGPRCVPCQHNTLAFPWDAGAD